ncbi:putative metal-binding motif-containing protein [Nanoarchaeota archaeon]
MKRIFLMSVFTLLIASMLTVGVAAYGATSPCKEITADCGQYTDKESCAFKYVSESNACRWDNGQNACVGGARCKVYETCDMTKSQGSCMRLDQETCTNTIFQDGGGSNSGSPFQLYYNCFWAGNSCRSAGNNLCVEPPACEDADGDGFLDAACGGEDCDDTNAEINPFAEEIVGDAFDNDCDEIAVCDSSDSWKNHGEFVKCVARETSNRGGEVTTAAKSLTGKAILGSEATWLGLSNIVLAIGLVLVVLKSLGRHK